MAGHHGRLLADALQTVTLLGTPAFGLTTLAADVLDAAYRRRFAEVLGPKITGTQVLDEALGGRELDFVCYFSSAAAILGDFGACDYAIGNRFLMAHAHARNARQERGERHVDQLRDVLARRAGADQQRQAAWHQYEQAVLTALQARGLGGERGGGERGVKQ